MKLIKLFSGATMLLICGFLIYDTTVLQEFLKFLFMLLFVGILGYGGFVTFREGVEQD